MKKFLFSLGLAVAAYSAITTLDGVISGMRLPDYYLKVGATMEAAGVPHSLFYTSGMPGAATANAQALGGVALTTGCATCSGQMPFQNPGSGNSYLARLSATCTTNGTLILADRLWHNDTIAETTTTGQTITSATWPARDIDASTNGNGVLVAIEVSTATTNGAAIANTTLTYTNQAGTGSRTATITSFPATAVAGTFIPFQFQAGDTGARSIQTLTLGTTYGGGTIHLVAYRIIGQVECIANVGAAIDAVSGGLPRLFNDTVPFLIFIPSATTATTIQGQMVRTEG
jgi:hypothetical protein